MARPRKATTTEESEAPRRRRRPATTTEGRENHLMNLAMDLAERQLEDGTASSQVQTHFLKLATVREEIERDKLRNEVKLLQARVESLQSYANSEELTREAIAAFTGYIPEQTSDDFNG